MPELGLKFNMDNQNVYGVKELLFAFSEWCIDGTICAFKISCQDDELVSQSLKLILIESGVIVIAT